MQLEMVVGGGQGVYACMNDLSGGYLQRGEVALQVSGCGTSIDEKAKLCLTQVLSGRRFPLHCPCSTSEAPGPSQSPSPLGTREQAILVSFYSLVIGYQTHPTIPPDGL